MNFNLLVSINVSPTALTREKQNIASKMAPTNSKASKLISWKRKLYDFKQLCQEYVRAQENTGTAAMQTNNKHIQISSRYRCIQWDLN